MIDFSTQYALEKYIGYRMHVEKKNPRYPKRIIFYRGMKFHDNY